MLGRATAETKGPGPSFETPAASTAPFSKGSAPQGNRHLPSARGLALSSRRCDLVAQNKLQKGVAWAIYRGMATDTVKVYGKDT